MCIMRGFRRVRMDVGNTSGGVYNITPDARSDSVGVRNVMTNDGGSHTRVFCKSLLEPES